MKDLISRQAAIDAADRADYTGLAVEDVKKVTDEVVKELKQLPSAQPERKKGKWIYHPTWETDGECGYECDQCGMGSDVNYDFCPRCGSVMRG